MRSLRALLALILATTTLASAGPVFNGAVTTYDVASCVNSTATSCTFSLTSGNSYGAGSKCFAQDTSVATPVAAQCSASGTTVTVTTLPTFVATQCTMATATTCTATLPYTASSSFRCVFADTTNIGAVKCTVSGTTVTVTASASNSDTYWGFVFVSNPSATGRTFNFFVTQ